MKLGLCGKVASAPSCECGGFGMAHVRRPCEGQADLCKERAIEPPLMMEAPEFRMLDPFTRDPFPRFRGPERSVPISTGFDELHVLVVRHVIHVDQERGYMDRLRLEFIVPGKWRHLF